MKKWKHNSFSHCPLHRTAVTFSISLINLVLQLLWICRHCLYPHCSCSSHVVKLTFYGPIKSTHRNNVSNRKKLHVKYFPFYNNNRTKSMTKKTNIIINRLCLSIILHSICFGGVVWWNWFFIHEISSNFCCYTSWAQIKNQQTN